MLKNLRLIMILENVQLVIPVMLINAAHAMLPQRKDKSTMYHAPVCIRLTRTRSRDSYGKMVSMLEVTDGHVWAVSTARK